MNLRRFVRVSEIFLGLFLVCAGGISAASLPAGFSERTYVSGFGAATTFAFAPDGRLFICEQGGKLRVVTSTGGLLATPFIDLSSQIQPGNERGLLGIAFDPDFATNNYLYLYYTAKSPAVHNRVSRFTANGNVVVPGSETVLFDLSNLSSNENHNGGALHFGLDGKLYVAAGDNRDPNNAPSLGTTHGKILRLNPHPSNPIPSDNPFVAQSSGNYQAIYARGFRNPFTFAIHPVSGRMLVNDVGENWREEINDVQAGKNYGWPQCEGSCAPSIAGLTDPISEYGHGPDCSIVGAAFYRAGAMPFPAAYADTYFFADLCAGWIKRLNPANNSVTTFATGYSLPVDLRVGPDGALYVLLVGGSVVKIEYTLNQAPSIVAHPANRNVGVGQTASFSVSASGSSLQFQWQRNNFDIPGATQAVYVTTPAVFADDGTAFRCVVSNAFGSVPSSAAFLTVTGLPPTASITAPSPDFRFIAGQLVVYSASATDPEDGTLPAGAFAWDVNLHHNDSGEHSHPGPPPVFGVTTSSFTPSQVEETSSNIWYRVNLTVTDSQGLTFSTFTDVLPQKSTMTFATNPAGLSLTLDALAFVSPKTVVAIPGVLRDVGVPSPQMANGFRYSFAFWSDGGASSHTVLTPTGAATFTAHFSAADVSSPSVPAGLSAVAVSSTQVSLSWSSSTDNVGVSGYRIFRDGVQVGTSASASFLNPNLLPSTTYSFRVSAYDAAGNVSNLSASVSTATLPFPADSTPPSVFISAPSSGASVSGNVNVTAVPSDNVGVLKVEFYVDGTLRLTAGGAPYVFPWDTLSSSNGAHSLAAKAFDAALNSASSTIPVTVDNPVPDTSSPTLSSVNAGSVGFSSAVVYWQTHEPADSQVEYGFTALYGSATSVNAAFLATHSHLLAGLAGGATYHYRVRSRDAAGNLAVSGDFSFVTQVPPAAPDVSSPTVPSNFFAVAVSSTRIDLSWFASTDNTGVSGYRVFRDGVQIASAASTSFVNANLSPSTTYAFRVSAYDAAGNVSNLSASVSTVTFPPSAPPPDTTPPALFIVSPVNGSTVTGTIVVTASATDSAGISRVDFYLDGALKASDSAIPYAYSFDALAESNGAHSVLVRAYDLSLNTAAATLSLIVNNPDVSSPTVPSGLFAVAISSTRIDVSWSAASDNVGVAGYRISRGGIDIATTALTSFGDYSLASATTYSYRVAAFDAAGNQSALSASVSTRTFSAAVPPDTTPPAFLGIGAVNIGFSSAAIQWVTNEAADSQTEYGFTSSYGSSTALDSTRVTSHVQILSGLPSGATVHYRVRSRDAAGNLAQSDDFVFLTHSVTTAPPVLDVSSPSAPSNVAAVAVSSSQIDLSWSASTDNAGVQDYALYRDGAQIAVTSLTQYRDSGLSASTTYAYRVAARDAAGNRSLPSTEASARTQDRPAPSNAVYTQFMPQGGGLISIPGSHRISIPPLALSSGTELSISIIENFSPGELDAMNSNRTRLEMQPASDAVEFGPDGIVFSQPVSISLRYNASLSGSVEEGRLALCYWNRAALRWEPLATRVNTFDRTATAEVSHFSLYQVMSPAAPAASAAAPPFQLNELYSYPNPARDGRNPVIHVETGLADSVELQIFDVSGARLLDQKFASPTNGGGVFVYEYVWNVADVPSGIYQCAVTAKKAGSPDQRRLRKIAVIK